MPAMVDLSRLDVHVAHFLVAKISSRVAVAYFYAKFFGKLVNDRINFLSVKKQCVG